jgi:hypothetical protein
MWIRLCNYKLQIYSIGPCISLAAVNAAYVRAHYEIALSLRCYLLLYTVDHMVFPQWCVCSGKQPRRGLRPVVFDHICLGKVHGIMAWFNVSRDAYAWVIIPSSFVSFMSGRVYCPSSLGTGFVVELRHCLLGHQLPGRQPVTLIGLSFTIPNAIIGAIVLDMRQNIG